MKGRAQLKIGLLEMKDCRSVLVPKGLSSKVKNRVAVALLRVRLSPVYEYVVQL